MPAAVNPEVSPAETRPSTEKGPIEGRSQTVRAKFHTIAGRFGTVLATLRKDNPTIRLDQETEDLQVQAGNLDQLGGGTAQKLGIPEAFQKAFLDEEQQEQEVTRHPNLPKIDEFPEKMRATAKVAYDKARTLVEEIEGYARDGMLAARAREIQGKIYSQIGMPYGHYSTSRELASVMDGLQEVLNRSREGLQSPNKELEEITERLEGLNKMQKNIADAERENETFPASHELLAHAVGFNLHVSEELSRFSRSQLESILRTGVLASRKYQIDTQGISYAHTGGRVIIGEDFVEYTEDGIRKRIPKENYAELYGKGHRLSKPTREQYQLFFSSLGKSSDGRGNDRWQPYFTNSVSFVFSKPSLYSQSQFNEHGEVELYDSNYDSSNSNSQGFHIDLTEEPMFIVVDEAIRDSFMKFVKGLDSPLWQNNGQDVDTWLRENVMFAPTGNIHDEPDKFREVYRRIEKRFFEKYHIDIPQGRFMPTGNKPDSPTQDTTYIYKAR